MNANNNQLRANQWLTPAEIDTLLDFVRRAANRRRDKPRRHRDRIIVETLLFAGLRSAELAALNLRDLPSHTGKQGIQVIDGKGGKSRWVPIPAQLATLLTQFVERWRPVAGPDEPLLVGKTGNRISPKGIWQTVTRIGRWLGYDAAAGRQNTATRNSLYPHRLRHSFAMISLREGNLDDVSVKLGHSSLQVTQIYTRTGSEESQRVADAIYR